MSAGLAYLDRGHEFAAEIGDVGDDAPPYEVAVAEGGLIHPGRAGIHQVVLDAQAAGGALAVHDPGRDPDQAGMLNNAPGGLIQRGMTITAFAWVVLLAARLLRQQQPAATT